MRIRRGDLTDLYIEGGRGVVMVGENVLVLSEVATQIVITVPETAAVGIEQVMSSVVATFGEPEPPATADQLTLQQVHELAAHGVLVVEEDGDTWSRDGSQGDLLDHRGEQRATAVDALRGALRHLVSEDSAVWTPPPGVDPSGLVAAATQHHVVPFVAARLERLALHPSADADLRMMAGRMRAGASVLAADLARAMDVLDAAGVRALAFKGVALASQAYGDFAARGAGDLDLLVAPSDLESAHEALSAAGWGASPDYPAPGTSWGWRHFVRTGNELPLISPRTMIDLHWHLTPTRGTFPSFETLWSRRQMVGVDGHEVPTLSRYDALSHSAGHAAKDHWKWLRSLLDVHRLASQRETWKSADRPLRGDQLITLGLAARIFGRPDDAPPVIDHALELAHETWDSVLAEQAGTPVTHTASKIPGHNFARNLRTTSRTGGTPREALRLFARSAMPPWLTAEESSPHPAVVVPRVLTRRARELLAKGRAAGR